jgi:hypothetical protein
MDGRNNQACPLCQRNAAYRFVDHDDGRKAFDCRACTRFQISVLAEKYLAEHIRSSGGGLSDKARLAAPDETLVIFIDADGTLRDEYVPNTELPGHLGG